MFRSIRLKPARRASRDTAVAIALFRKPDRLPPGYDELDRATDGRLRRAVARPDFNAELGNLTTLTPDAGPRRIDVLGLGDPARFDGNALRVAAARLVRALDAAQLTRVHLDVQPGLGDRLEPDRIGMALGDGLEIGRFEFDRFRGAVGQANDDAPARKTPRDLDVDLPEPQRGAFERALTIGQAVTTARALAATPPNVANPAHIARQAKRLADQLGLRCTVLDARRMKQLGMGGLLAVGNAGSAPPVLICLEHTPKRPADKRAGSKRPAASRGKNRPHDGPVLLVGKAITFDTGGYSLKSTGGLGMKYDKCGGMAVLGAMEACARLGVDRHVVGLIPCAENMIATDAYRPDDILTLANGVTVEVTNTDAEGRLILADALAYGTDRYKPSAVIDLATLTGGVVTALGTHCAGLFCNDDELLGRLEAAADRTGERLWRLPLWHEHRELMKGTHGDLVNSNPARKASPIQGAVFLSYFVGPDAPRTLPTLPWAHLDIAGVASLDNDTPLFPKGPTGFGIRLLAELLGDQ